MLMAHKIALNPNNTQATYFARASGTARFAYNWALAEWQRQYEAWKADNRLPKRSQAALRRPLNALKQEQYPWMLEVTKNAPQMAIMQLGCAFKNFWAGRAKYPKFRKIRCSRPAMPPHRGGYPRPAMEEGSGLRRKMKTKPASVKQEVSFVPV